MPRTVNTTAPRIVEIRTDVPSQWTGWRFTASGSSLVSPDGQHMTPHRLAGLLWRDSMELRRAGLRSRREAEKPIRRGPVKVVIVDLADWHARNVGSRAG
ncbi:DUF3653 domain-containing protein [Pseudoxanthomonas sp. SE1]|uniref:DUF3653 domain-containing protein n=1 Tax=Pseudoxanthomonas sp. SE1 TaxID=1664560 RepID=UPI00240DCC0C|nr:DUF3653 domain-containing protein [Pseudoxanthomonas sp. SE1]WFC43776.1 DUF3653 domain-containing protein [Pseudoxanthomonas sp. SE1]